MRQGLHYFAKEMQKRSVQRQRQASATAAVVSVSNQNPTRGAAEATRQSTPPLDSRDGNQEQRQIAATVVSARDQRQLAAAVASGRTSLP